MRQDVVLSLDDIAPADRVLLRVVPKPLQLERVFSLLSPSLWGIQTIIGGTAPALHPAMNRWATRQRPVNGAEEPDLSGAALEHGHLYL